ncbi:maleylpyruvate isomerase N-terminal domain-containing protein [Gordonia amicalis]|uniref:Maleylpyruvate isomerase N-terminal domain-containing protein n=1 Tax=Gordonia amicalis TaxID=89053 RepID=A0ABU4D878_9ACTN|nr:maleylpyruvate isomerase N-terminal domain-containing protein [Gordonia amicalis]MDV6305923.1 maleylpyruvate isomerase N-terminal domain-containing protein [Gordonia amicalis]MDV7098790.1 maleylpyruvate isomerase N-terminal domain-containing protein [Gordonia amicalis]
MNDRQMNDPGPWLDEAARLWADHLANAGPERLRDASGCAGWTNRDLINHLIGGGYRYSMLLEGASAADTLSTRDVDYLEAGDPIAEFWRSENAFRAAVGSADLDVDVDHRAGRRPGRQLLVMRIMELALHSHDLCVGIDAEWEPSDGLVGFLLTDAAPVIEELRAAGLFEAPIEPASESAADRLLAFAGRS